MKKVYQKRGLDRVTKQTPVAKCGHPSTTRYFKCEDCQPLLPNEDGFLYVGSEGDDEEIENEFGSEDDIVNFDFEHDDGCLE